MKKIPTLFERVFDENKTHKIIDILPNVTSGMEWVLDGEGIATVKWDGSPVALIDGVLYKRYDAKPGKKVPEGAIECQKEPDPTTGHFPHWVKCNRDDNGDRWFFAAYDTCGAKFVHQQTLLTFEAVGKHFNGNPYNYEHDILIPHGEDHIYDLPRTFEGIRDYLRDNNIEGIVFWKDGEPRCKIKRTDFGFPWNSHK